MKFKDLGLIDPILKAIEENNYETPTPIQSEAIPYILNGKDILACAQTGTGKTAAFALPLIQLLVENNSIDHNNKKIKVLVLTPTRELAIQIRDNFRKYSINTNLRCGVILGGVNQKSQVEVLKRGVDILIATPGRLLDLVNQRHINLSNVSALVLDEADTMLDMGFINDVKKIVAHVPIKRQTLLFSATMPNAISTLANAFLTDHVTIKVNVVSSTAQSINQSIYFIDKSNKTTLLIELLKNNDIKSVLIFTRTKHGANKLSETLEKNGVISGVIHGNKSQSARVTALSDFKRGKTRVLIATDIAAHGIDINELSHVINYEIPNLPETYVHRIGRTGRAGLDGTAISFCDFDEQEYLKDIQKLIKKEILVINDHKYPMQQTKAQPKVSNVKFIPNKSFKKPTNSKYNGNSGPKKFNSSAPKNNNYKKNFASKRSNY